jgi:hypothetical protein
MDGNSELVAFSAAALVIVFYALREAREIFRPGLLGSRAVANAREAP